MQTPIIIVNFKTYDKAYGEKAIKLAQICEKVSREHGCHIAVAVSATDLYMVSRSVSIPVLAQHIDDVDFGSHTGYLLAEDIKEAGAAGTLLNHSEHRLGLDILERSIKRAKAVGLATIVCVNDPIQAKAVANFAPDFIAIEPPELIGGDVSISKECPEVIDETITNVREVADIPIIIGAGVKTSDDVKIGLELGAKGILVASGVTKALSPEEALNRLILGLI